MRSRRPVQGYAPEPALARAIELYLELRAQAIAADAATYPDIANRRIAVERFLRPWLLSVGRPVIHAGHVISARQDRIELQRQPSVGSPMARTNPGRKATRAAKPSNRQLFFDF